MVKSDLPAYAEENVDISRVKGVHDAMSATMKIKKISSFFFAKHPDGIDHKKSELRGVIFRIYIFRRRKCFCKKQTCILQLLYSKRRFFVQRIDIGTACPRLEGDRIPPGLCDLTRIYMPKINHRKGHVFLRGVQQEKVMNAVVLMECASTR